MRNLEDFSVPNDGEVTVCQVNGRIHCMKPEFSNISTFTTSIEKFPKIHITRELLHPTGLFDEGRTLFVTTDATFLKELSRVFSDQGLTEALRTASSHNQPAVSRSATILLTVLDFAKKIRQVLYPTLQYSAPNLINELNQTRYWSRHSIRTLAWHPHVTRLAVATCDDSVQIYTSDSSFVPLLRCKQQKNVTCLAWRPMSLTEIAVGHEDGIIVWNIDFNSLVLRPSASNAVMLHRIEHKPVMSLVWSPKGDTLLSAAACQSTLIVWDVELNRVNYLKGSREPGNVLLKWSPAKDKLLSVSNGIVFRIWDCRTWESDRWTVLNGRVQSACWANGGTNLLFATTTDPVIYGLMVNNELLFAGNSTNPSNHAIPLVDLSKIDLEGVAVGGIVQSMETDPKGNHLAVLFKDTNCVAVFNVTKHPTLQLISSSLITGLAAEVPSTIAFHQNFKPGACLSIGWSSGRVQHFPIIYTDLSNDFNGS